MSKLTIVYKEITPEITALVVYALLCGKEFELTDKLPIKIPINPEPYPLMTNIELTRPGMDRGIIPNKFKPHHKRRF
jgi:hypothetical protein